MLIKVATQFGFSNMLILIAKMQPSIRESSGTATKYIALLSFSAETLLYANSQPLSAGFQAAIPTRMDTTACLHQPPKPVTLGNQALVGANAIP